jgi:hypothetical protein
LKFAIRIEPIWRPLMLVGGATAANSYVEVDDDTLRLRFGLFFDQRVARSNIVSAAERSWPLWRGIGWRAWGETLGLIGSTEGVVEMRLKDAVRVRMGLIPWPFGILSIAVSLDDPSAFLGKVSVADTP